MLTNRLSKPPSFQAFDEHLSLNMPVSFDPVTDMPVPVEQLSPETRKRVQKATQRTAFFKGVKIAVFDVTPIPGVVAPGEQHYGVQSALDGCLLELLSSPNASQDRLGATQSRLSIGSD